MTGGIVLAAGSATRMKATKQLIAFEGTTLVRRAVEAASSVCDPVVVVLGAHAEQVRPELDGLTVEILVNREWARGMSRSIRAGVEALEASTVAVDAALILGCDQPHVTSQVLGRLCDAFDGKPRRRVASEYAGTVGMPALFERSLFPELKRLQGDRGAKPLLLEQPELLIRVAWSEGAVDLDRPEDLA